MRSVSQNVLSTNFGSVKWVLQLHILVQGGIVNPLLELWTFSTFFHWYCVIESLNLNKLCLALKLFLAAVTANYLDKHFKHVCLKLTSHGVLRYLCSVEVFLNIDFVLIFIFSQYYINRFCPMKKAFLNWFCQTLTFSDYQGMLLLHKGTLKIPKINLRRVFGVRK